MIENFLKDGMIFEESNWIWFFISNDTSNLYSI